MYKQISQLMERNKIADLLFSKMEEEIRHKNTVEYYQYYILRFIP